MNDKIARFLVGIILVMAFCTAKTQDLSQGLAINDLDLHPMQDVRKPGYLDTIIDPSFGTTIRRITDAGAGGEIVPMYSTVQAWNADESYMILYDRSAGRHQLLNGHNYEFIRYLDDVTPSDVEEIFWDFNAPDTLYYLDRNTDDFILYRISNQSKEILINLSEVSSCTASISLGNDVQMMSWDSDLICFRCGNEASYSYRLSTEALTRFSMDVEFVAPAASASGAVYYHVTRVYDDAGDFSLALNETNGEHSCIGKLTNGNDAHFAIAFEEGPQGGCIGDIIAHDLSSGHCFPLISQEQGYDYPQSGTHISALAHKNSEGGWVAASMIGYDQDGQELLDQELVIAKAEEGNVKVCRIGHHRSDEDQFEYWGEPHAVISPLGTRVLFGSDWSGADDGNSLDSYVVELPAYESALLPVELIDFELDSEGMDVAITWSTVTETQSAYFAIERSADNVDWLEMGQVQAAGNSAERQDYRFTDNNAWSGKEDTWYYRLRIVDIDGTATYSAIESIVRVMTDTPSVKTTRINILPNPTDGVVFLHHSEGSSLGLARYVLVNSTGQNVQSGTINVAQQYPEIDFTGINPGLYLLFLKSCDLEKQIKIIIR